MSRYIIIVIITVIVIVISNTKRYDLYIYKIFMYIDTYIIGSIKTSLDLETLTTCYLIPFYCQGIAPAIYWLTLLDQLITGV